MKSPRRALGVKLDVSPEIARECIKDIGIAFLFAPVYHRAMKHAVAPRKEIGVRTIFNVLGPLANPAPVTGQVIGVYDGALTAKIAGVLGNLGLGRAFVVHGIDMIDEVSITGGTKVSELRDGKVSSYEVTPETFGLRKAGWDDIKGGSAADNAQIVRSILSGEEGPRLDIVLMNASLALMAADRAGDPRDGVQKALESIASGKAAEKLDGLIRMTTR